MFGNKKMTFVNEVESGFTQRVVAVEETDEGFIMRQEEFWKGEPAGFPTVAGNRFYPTKEEAILYAESYVADLVSVGYEPLVKYEPLNGYDARAEAEYYLRKFDPFTADASEAANHEMLREAL